MTDETVDDDATVPDDDPSSEDPAPADDHADHLADVPDGAGCTEIWDHLSAERDDE